MGRGSIAYRGIARRPTANCSQHYGNINEILFDRFFCFYARTNFPDRTIRSLHARVNISRSRKGSTRKARKPIIYPGRRRVD